MKMRATERLYELWNLPTSVVERVSMRAGLKKAKQVYLCSHDDAYNLLIALTIQKFKKREGLNCKVKS